MKVLRKDGYRVEDGKVCIDLSLKQPNQLFDSRDPAPFLERDLDDDAVDYIISAAQEFGDKTPIKLQIFFSHKDQTAVTDAEIAAAIRHYFKYTAAMTSKKLSRAIRTAQFFLLIGILLLIGCLSGAELLGHLSQAHIFKLLKSGLEIAGWVALWRPLELLFFDWWPTYDKKKTVEKIAHMEIRLTDTQTNFTTISQSDTQ